MNADRHWQAALGQFQLELPRAAYDTWVRDTELLTYEDGTYIVGVRNAYARDWLEDRLLPTAKQVLAGISGRTVEVRFVVWQGDPADELREASLTPLPIPTNISASSSNLNPRYTFSAFVVGPNNRLAYAAARAVAENPARAYNPLFLYGGVGLGKTHLLHALGQECAANGLNVLYVSSEEFTNDLIDSIRKHRTDTFRERYRNIDLLLIDDIQFIVGKESTQEEFFHTFNSLHAQDKQIVVSSDRPPKAMVTLEERLRSRFEWGLAADIQTPEFETRMAILCSKAERAGHVIDTPYLEMIAQRVQRNIRELEGALTRVMAYSQLRGMPLDAALVEAALTDFSLSSPTITPDRILAVVAEDCDVPEDQLLGRSRRQEIALARQMAMYLMREETKASLPQIGTVLGGRDHTTVMHGCAKIADLLDVDESLRQMIAAMRSKLHNGIAVAV
jgi:chromosomal replication initiator protein